MSGFLPAELPSPRSWRRSELSLLDRLYPLGGAVAVRAHLPHRSIGTIRNRAKSRGVRLVRPSTAVPVRHGEPWTSAELDVLRDLYPRGGAMAVNAAIPGRALQAIRAQAKRHGLLFQQAPTTGE